MVNFEIYHVTRIKGKHTMKFGQLIEYPKRIFFFKNYAENEARKLVLNRFFLKAKKKKEALH